MAENAASPDLVIDGDTADFSRWAMGLGEAAKDLKTVRTVDDTTGQAELDGGGQLLLIEGPPTGALDDGTSTKALVCYSVQVVIL